jgi:hypothetical protein
VEPLYEPLLERDLDGIRAAVAQFRTSHSAEDFWRSIARFAVLAYAPSQHAKHAVLTCLSAWELREELGARFDDAVTECAIYAATSRQPWSEPPISDSPQFDPDEVIDLASADRLAAERWLAQHVDDADLRQQLFDAASRDLSDMGHKVIVANAAWKLAEIFGPHGRFATLRIAMWELTAYHGEADVMPSDPAKLIDDAEDIESLHRVFLLDAALEMESRSRDVAESRADVPRDPATTRPRDLPIYTYARDYGACLKAHAVAKRWRSRFPSLDSDRIIAAAWRNLRDGISFEDFSFA